MSKAPVVEKRIIRARLRCLLCDTVIESRHRHDFNRCECGNAFIDGGRDYERYGWGAEDSVETLYEYAGVEVRKWHALCHCGVGWNALGQAHCPTCHLHFVNTRAFDMHRKGPVDNRRCDTTGLVKTPVGVWGRPGEFRPSDSTSGSGDDHLEGG